MDQNIIKLFEQIKRVDYNNLMVAVLANYMCTERPDMPEDTALTLSQAVYDIMVEEDEPKFTCFDYADAICNSQYAPEFPDLMELCRRDKSAFNRLLILMADQKRAVYSDLDSIEYEIELTEYIDSLIDKGLLPEN